jgi:hypothetical protein
MNIDLKAIHLKSSRHEADILKSKLCGCFFCLEIYPPNEIDPECWWEEDNTYSTEIYKTEVDKTVFCPKCGIDSVLPDNIGYELTKDLLIAMKSYYFYPEE